MTSGRRAHTISDTVELREALGSRVVCGEDSLRVDLCVQQELLANAERDRAIAERIPLGFDPVDSTTIAPTAPAPVVLAGLPHPWLLDRAIKACGVCSDGYVPRVLVVEPDGTRCGTALSCIEIPAHASVEIYAGEQAQERFVSVLRSRFDEALPKTILSLQPEGSFTVALQNDLRAIWSEQAVELDRLRNAVERNRSGRTPAWWASRYDEAFSGGTPLRVAVISSRYSTFVRHAASRFAEAVERAGHTARLLIEPDPSVRFSALAGVRLHAEYDPDLVVSINWPRPSLASSWPGGVPSVCWIQDAMPHLFDRSVGEAMGPLDFIAGQVHGSLSRDYAYPVTNRLFAPVPACERLFGTRPADDCGRFGVDVAYISHQSETVDAFVDRAVQGSASAPGTVRLLKLLAPRVIEAVSRESLSVTPDLWTLTCETAKEALGTLPEQAATNRLYLHFVLPLAERAFRHETLRWAAHACSRNGWSMRIFGNGWDRHPEFAACAAPGIPHGPQLRDAYAHAGCHLHASLQTNAHQRVFECALAGGVMLRRGPTADRSVFQTEVARQLDLEPCRVTLPDGSVIIEEPPENGPGRSGARLSDRLQASVGHEVQVIPTPSGARRLKIPAAFAALRPLWVPQQPLELYPDWSFATSGETLFWSPEQLEGMIRKAINDRDWRSRVIDDHRSVTRRENTFDGFWRRLSGFVHARLGQHAKIGGTDTGRLPTGTLDRNLAALDEVLPEISDALRERLRSRPIRTPSSRTNGTVLDNLRGSLDAETVVAVHGIGDGALLRTLQDRPTHMNGRRTAVHIVEPDAERLLAALAMIDLSDPDGPIRGGDVEWYVGENWEAQILERFESRPMLPLPRAILRPDPSAKIPDQIWSRVNARFEAEQRSLAGAAFAWAEARDTIESFRAIRGERDRAARVLIMTSRFTTVLKHSADAAARAFEQLGWKVEVLCEPRDHERVTLRAALRLLDRFRPDLVFAIDHHRSSFPALPASIPFVCWIQDDLEALTSPAAARALGDTDFAIGSWVHRYIQQWGYPASACVSMPRLTDARPPRSSSPRFNGIDLCYISGYSRTPGSAREELLESVSRSPEFPAIERVCDELLGIYERGDSVTLPREIAGMLTRACESRSIDVPGDSRLADLAEMVQHRLNNTLYRQQGLEWAAEIAKESGLTLAVFGPGWEQHPRFAEYARGPVRYGDELAELHASAGATLRLEPYPPTSHQRLLDALASGGRVLSRSYGSWHESENAFVSCFLEHLAGTEYATDEAFERVPPSVRSAFLEHAESLRDAFGLANLEAVLERYQYRVKHGLLEDYKHSPIPPRYFETVFSDKAGLRALTDRLKKDPKHFESISEVQGAFVREHYSYPGALRRVMQEIGCRLLRRASDSRSEEAA